MANLFTLQDHLEVIKTGSPDQKNKKLTRESIADVRNFIATERANRSAGTNYGLESQFHEWEDLIVKFEGDKQIITQNTATATSGVRVTPIPLAESLAPTESLVVSQNLKDLKSKLEQENNAPISVASLQKILDSLRTEILGDARAILMNLAWSRLASGGFITSIQAGRIVVQNPKDPAQAAAFELTLNNQLNTTFPLSEMQSAILTGTGKFGVYTETQLGYPEKASLEEYVSFLTRQHGLTVTIGNPADKEIINRDPRLSPSERAFLISYIDGGYAGYNVVPDVKRSIEFKKQDVELKSSPTYMAVAATVDKVSKGAAQKERQQMQEQGGPEAEMTMESFMANPTEAIARYPWTTLTLLIGGIWKFGFMKTIGGVLVGMVGIKAINELGGTKLGAEIKAGLNKGATAAREVTSDALESGKAAVAGAGVAVAEATKPAEKPAETLSSLTPFQQLAQKEVMKESSRFNTIIQSHSKAIPKQSASLDDYVGFLQSDAFQNQKLENILYSQNPKASIFQNEKNWDLSIRIPGNMDSVILKKIFRQYLTGSFLLGSPDQGQQEGDNEKATFEKMHGFSDTDRSKSLKDILPNIYK